jgi:hypothetical protein
VDNASSHPPRLPGRSENVTITGISQRDISLRIPAESRGAEEARIERVEGVHTLAEQVVSDMERDKVDKARILAIVPERLSDVRRGLEEIVAEDFGPADDEPLGVVDEGERKVRVCGDKVVRALNGRGRRGRSVRGGVRVETHSAILLVPRQTRRLQLRRARCAPRRIARVRAAYARPGRGGLVLRGDRAIFNAAEDAEAFDVEFEGEFERVGDFCYGVGADELVGGDSTGVLM